MLADQLTLQIYIALIDAGKAKQTTDSLNELRRINHPLNFPLLSRAIFIKLYNCLLPIPSKLNIGMSLKYTKIFLCLLTYRRISLHSFKFSFESKFKYTNF